MVIAVSSFITVYSPSYTSWHPGHILYNSVKTCGEFIRSGESWDCARAPFLHTTLTGYDTQTPLVYLETCHLTAPSSQAACCGLPTVTKQGRVFPSQSSGSVNRQGQFWVMRFLPYGHVHLGRWHSFTSILSFFLSEKAAINNSVHQLKKQLGSKGPLGCLGMKGRTHRPLVYIGKYETGRSHCQVDGVSSQY